MNSAIRAGLAAERGGGRPYRTPTWPMGVRPGVDLTNALQIAAALEDEEIIRTMERRTSVEPFTPGPRTPPTNRP
jgi:hypothetical protein